MFKLFSFGLVLIVSICSCSKESPVVITNLPEDVDPMTVRSKTESPSDTSLDNEVDSDSNSEVRLYYREEMRSYKIKLEEWTKTNKKTVALLKEIESKKDLREYLDTLKPLLSISNRVWVSRDQKHKTSGKLKLPILPVKSAEETTYQVTIEKGNGEEIELESDKLSLECRMYIERIWLDQKSNLESTNKWRKDVELIEKEIHDLEVLVRSTEVEKPSLPTLEGVEDSLRLRKERQRRAKERRIQNRPKLISDFRLYLTARIGYQVEIYQSKSGAFFEIRTYDDGESKRHSLKNCGNYWRGFRSNAGIFLEKADGEEAYYVVNGKTQLYDDEGLIRHVTK